MHNRKNLVRIVALALTLGMTGVVSSYADEIIVEPGQTVKLDNRDVHGAWAKEGATIIANNVNFLYGDEHNQEVTADGGTLEITGGTIDCGMDWFSADSESKVTTNGTVIKTGVWANNSHFELNDSTITGDYLYAGNAGTEGHDEYNGTQSGQIYIRGGTTNVEHVHAWNAGTVKLTGKAQLTATDVTVNGRDVTDATIEMKDDKGNTQKYGAQKNTNVISDKGNEKSYFRVVWGGKS